MNSRSYSDVRVMSTPEGVPVGSVDRDGGLRCQRSMRRMTSTASEGSAHPGRPGAAVRLSTARAGNPSSTLRRGGVARCLAGALLDARSGADDGLRPGGAEVADDRGGLDDAASADVAAVDHGAGPDDDVVLDDQLLVRQQVQHGVLQDLDA